MHDGHLTTAGASDGDDTGKVLDSENLAIGVVDELSRFMGDLPHDAAFDPDAAIAAAAEYYLSTVRAATAAAAVGNDEDIVHADRGDGIAIVIGGRATRLALGDEIIVGRSTEHRVDHPAVSRRHLCIRMTPEGLHCHDLGSANGSLLVRGRRRTVVGGTDVPIVAADRIVTGGDVEILYVPGGP